MKITRRSEFTGIERTLDLPITEEQIKLYENGALIQVAFPNLTNDQREFLMTGVVREEWDQFMIHPEDKEEDDANRGYN